MGDEVDDKAYDKVPKKLEVGRAVSAFEFRLRLGLAQGALESRSRCSARDLPVIARKDDEAIQAFEIP